MAKMTVIKSSELSDLLAKLGRDSKQIAQAAIEAGAGILADRVRANIDGLPEEPFRKLQDGEKFSAVPEGVKNDLLEGLGITPVGIDNSGDVNAKVGFEGYGSTPTKKYPKGVPNPLLAASVESGSSVRKKTPFLRPAVNATREKIIAEMQKKFDEHINKLEK